MDEMVDVNRISISFLKHNSPGLGGPGKEYRGCLRSFSGLDNFELAFVPPTLRGPRAVRPIDDTEANVLSELLHSSRSID